MTQAQSLLIAFAGVSEFSTSPSTPTLDRLLACWGEVERDSAPLENLNPPHERAFAKALAWSPERPWPWAARLAAADGVKVGTLAWGLLTPVHWRVDAQAIYMANPQTLELGEDESRALLECLRPWLEQDGFAVAWGAPLRWYVAHECLASLRAASLDRVIGRNVDPWLPGEPEARLIRRLQTEAQMLLATHPLNAVRQARGLPVVNSFWLSGCGTAQPESPHGLHIDDRLRQPALAQNETGWLAAWAALDASLPAFTQLTLCGERDAVTLAPQRRAWWKFWNRSRCRVSDLLKTL